MSKAKRSLVLRTSLFVGSVMALALGCASASEGLVGTAESMAVTDILRMDVRPDGMYSVVCRGVDGGSGPGEIVSADDIRADRVCQSGVSDLLFCTPSDNLLKRGGSVLHDFQSPTDCQRASNELRTYGGFCTAPDNILKDRNGGTVHDFSNASDCQASLKSSGGLSGEFVFCTPSDNLLKRGSSVLHDFQSAIDCQRANQELRTHGAFCTSSDNVLKDKSGAVLHDFSSASACQASLTSGGGLSGEFVFCTPSDNVLKRGSSVLHDFQSPTDCQRANQEVRTHGAFCTSSDNVLKDKSGAVLHDFSSNVDCQNALLNR
jgi:hypothetical protein